MFSSRRATSTTGLAFALAMVLGACAQPTTSTPAAPSASGAPAASAAATAAAIPGGTMVERILGSWPTLDPQGTGTPDSSQITYGIYDRMVALIDGKAVPYLATKWTQTPDSVTFEVRKDVVCSDGQPLTATGMANSFKRLLVTQAPKIRSRIAGFGPGPYTITADDAASTMTVKIGQPYSGLLYAFGLPQAGVVCPKGLADPDALATTPQGSGAFVMESQQQGDSATVAVRPEWKWGPNGLTAKSPGFPQKVVYKVVVNDTTAANLLVTGGLDVGIIGGQDNTRLVNEASLIHREAHGYYSVVILFNHSAGRPTSDIVVRRALATAIDPASVGKAGYFSSTPATSLLASDAQCFDPVTKSLMPTPDVNKAKQIMKDAGYPVGADGKWRAKGGGPLTITIAGSINQGNGPDYLAEQFNSAGFDVKLNKTERATYVAAYVAGNYDVNISEGSADTPDPNGAGLIGLYTGTPQSQGGANAAYVQYPDIDQAIVAANAATGAESCKQWAFVQEELIKRVTILPGVIVNYQWYGRGIDVTPGVEARWISPIFLRRVK